MKYILSLFFIFSISFFSHSQTPDTIYVDQIDTVLVNEPPVILNSVFYQQENVEKKAVKNFSIRSSVGAATDFVHYAYCADCAENFAKLKSSYSATNSLQLGGQLSYTLKKFSLGIDVTYRHSSGKMRYDSDTLAFNSVISVKYIMVGPVVSYNIFQKNNWNIDIGMGILFSHTLQQRGKTIGGQQIDTPVDLASTKIIADKNILYHAAPTLGFAVNPSLSLLLITQYYFDLNSNVVKGISYTEQRNTIGVSLGVKYSL